MKEMKVQQRLISPDIAKTMLSSNKDNRKLSKATVNHYSREMTLGNWQLTPHGISFDIDGKLIDGQHRLTAIVVSGTSQMFMVFSNVPKSTFKVLDTGKKRNAGDMLSILNVKNSTNVSATINKYMALANGNSGPAIKVSNTIVLDVYNKNAATIDEIVSSSYVMYRKLKLLNLSEIASMIMYLHLDKGHSMGIISSFFEQLITGKDVSNSTIEILREKLINNAVSATKYTHKVKLNLIKRTWNAYVKNESLKRLNTTCSSENNVKFI